MLRLANLNISLGRYNDGTKLLKELIKINYRNQLIIITEIFLKKINYIIKL